jgi:hypothetical protein
MSVTFQEKASSAYPRKWLIFRCCDGDYLDPHATFNADWCRGAVVQGRMLGWTAYVVYRPGMNAAVLENLGRITPLDRVMIDVESWGGAIRGDHSDDINSLAAAVSHIVGETKVWLYGNTSDLGSIAPRRYGWLKLVVAAWGPNKPTLGNLIGWQYTDGQHLSGSRPLSSAPFGSCDHNELYVDELDPAGGGVHIDPPVPPVHPVEEDNVPRMVWFDTDGNGTGDACFLLYDNGVMAPVSGGSMPGVFKLGGIPSINSSANPINQPTYQSMKAASDALTSRNGTPA